MSRFFHICLWASALLIGCFAYGLIIEPKRFVVRHIDIKSPNWNGAPLTITLVADIHIGGPDITPQYVGRLVQRVNDLNSDLIVIPGDFVNGHEKRKMRSDNENRIFDMGFSELRHLKAPGGVYVSLGNHDAWYDIDHIRKRLSEMEGITLLDNRAMVLDPFCLVGVADMWTGKPHASVFELCPENQSIIAFMHSPDAKHVLPKSTALAMAGHTHGGQVNLPLIGRRITSTKLGKPYAYGLIWDDDMPVFVSAGIGTSILPIRFRAPPEIVVIRLSSAGL